MVKIHVDIALLEKEDNINELSRIIKTDLILDILSTQLCEVNILGFHEIPEQLQLGLDIFINNNISELVKYNLSVMSEVDKHKIIHLIMLNTEAFPTIEDRVKEQLLVDYTKFRKFIIESIGSEGLII